MASRLKVAGQTTLAGSLPEAGLQLAIEICANAIVWRTDRFKFPDGKTLDWTCNKVQISSAWYNIAAPRIMNWAEVPKSERVRLFMQCIHFAPPAMTILDPFMDTGDVLIAAIRLKKKFVGIEINQQRCDKAVKRIQERKKV